MTYVKVIRTLEQRAEATQHGTDFNIAMAMLYHIEKGYNDGHNNPVTRYEFDTWAKANHKRLSRPGAASTLGVFTLSRAHGMAEALGDARPFCTECQSLYCPCTLTT